MLDTAVVLAGGFGTRLRAVVSDVPKPMAPVASQPFLVYLLRYLKHYHISKVILCTGHLGQKVRDHFSDEFEGLELLYSHENSPLGTGGAIRQALSLTDAPQVLALNGDSFFDVPLDDLYQKHIAHSSQFSLALRQVENSGRYGAIKTDTQHRIIEFEEKKAGSEEGTINGGIYILDRRLFLSTAPAEKAFSVEQDFFSRHLRQFTFSGFVYTGYFIDIGIPEDYSKAQHDFKEFKYK